MRYRVIAAGVCVLILAGCQQSDPTQTSIASLTAPSSVSDTSSAPSLHPSVPFSGVVVGQGVLDFITNPKGCASGWTTITDAKGTASHMGATQWHSEHCFSIPDGHLLDAELVLTAANDDEIHGTYTGGCTSPPADIGDRIFCGGTAVFSGGTGRFANATGSAEWTGAVIWEGFDSILAPGRWEWKGSISY